MIPQTPILWKSEVLGPKNSAFYVIPKSLPPLPALPWSVHVSLCSDGSAHEAEAGAARVSVRDMLFAIQGKLTRGRRLAPIAAAGGKNVCLIGESSGRIKWIQPSGATCPSPGDMPWALKPKAPDPPQLRVVHKAQITEA